MHAEPPPEPRVGESLRALRQARGLTLSAVAESTAISTSFLSLVETGRSDITFGRLQRLLDFYGAEFSDLLPEESPPDPVIVRGGERRSLPSPEEGLEMFLLTHGGDHAMTPVVVEYGPGARLHEYTGGRGEVFVHIIEGELEFQLGGDPRFLLSAGDSAYYDTDRSVRIRNAGDGAATLLAVGAAKQPPGR